MRARILIADDHSLMVEGLRRLLSSEFEVVGTARNGCELLEKAENLQPDVVLLDVALPGRLNGIQAAQKISNNLHPSAKLVFVTQHLDPPNLRDAFAAGADAYVAKQSPPAELFRAIRMVLRGQCYITPLANSETSQQAKANPQHSLRLPLERTLTSRQREVLQLVAEGKTSKEISALLNISVKTVEFHRNSLMDVLGVRTVAQLTAYAILHGIVDV